MDSDLQTAADSADAGARQQYLTFALDGEVYGVDILRVQEIKGFTTITPIPNAPPHVRGVMNLRGTIVPVFDLRREFGLAEKAYDRFTVIVVVTVGTRIAGMVVDAVSDVLDIAPDAIEPAPQLGSTVDTSMIAGLARDEDRLITLLELDAVLDVGAGDRGGPEAAAA